MYETRCETCGKCLEEYFYQEMCECFECVKCGDMFNFEDIVKLSPGEFACHDCLNNIAERMNEVVKEWDGVHVNPGNYNTKPLDTESIKQWRRENI